MLPWARFVPAGAEAAQAPIELVVPPELARLVRRLPHVAEMIPLSRWDATDVETPPAVASGCSDWGPLHARNWRTSCDGQPARRSVMGIGILGLIGAIVVIIVILRLLGLW